MLNYFYYITTGTGPIRLAYEHAHFLARNMQWHKWLCFPCFVYEKVL